MAWTTPRTWTNGEQPAASMFNTNIRDNLAWTSHLLAYKSANETVNNTAVLQNDDALSFAVAAGETWSIRALIAYTSNTTADFKLSFTWPSAAGALIATYDTAASATVSRITFNSSGTTASIPGRTTESAIIMFGHLRFTGAGTVQLQWAQNTANASNTTVNIGSYIIGTRLT